MGEDEEEEYGEGEEESGGEGKGGGEVGVEVSDALEGLGGVQK